MAKTFSIYEAKAKLSELIRLVKSGNQIVVTERGNPVAKVIPFEKEETFESRIEAQIKSGRLIPGKPIAKWPKGQRKPGGLKRFLGSRE